MRLLPALLLVFSVAAGATSISPQLPVETCSELIPYGAPKSAKQDTSTICRVGFVYEHDNRAHIPVWVAYTLNRTKALGCFPRAERFRVDPALPKGASATAKDYAKSGYDIGHMAPDSDMRWARQASDDASIFSNAAPQLPGLNRAAWKALEVRTRTWALDRDLLIYVGPIYPAKGASTIGPSKVVVPTAFYKVLVDTKTGETVSFIYPQAESQKSPDAFRTTLAEVQRQTGLVLPMPKTAKHMRAPWPVVGSSVNAKGAACPVN